jgi:hypothetical protein
MRFIQHATITSMLALSGCATTSFSPPVVNLKHPTTVGSQAQAKCAAQIVADQTRSIDSNVAGARALINNFIYVYRCRAHSAANGRQWFEVPALLIAAGTVTAAAFGAGPDVAIAGGAGSAVLANGKGYYSPQQKAAIYDHALDALLCIKSEAVGVKSFDIAISETFKNAVADGKIEVDPYDQYFDMISSALFSVERILSQRLSSTGTFDAAGLVAEIEAIKKKVDDAEAAKAAAKKAAADEAGSGVGDDTGGDADGGADDSEGDGDAVKMLNNPDFAPAVNVQRFKAMTKLMQSPAGLSLDLDVLQPKLQQCVVRAKL